MKTLNIKQLSFLNFGPLDLTVNSTEIVGLSGHSGSGKSRLLRAVADLDEHQGEILLNQVSQSSIDAHRWRKQVALLPAETHWWFDRVDAHFSPEALSSLNLSLPLLGFSEEALGWDVARLSSGEKQRLGLLRLLQNQPDVLLLDEPTANLDKQNTALFEKLVIQYLQEQSACAIWVSHDIDQLQRVCQQHYKIENGKLKHVD